MRNPNAPIASVFVLRLGRRGRGFTLVELLLSASITGIIGFCVAAMINAAAAGTAGQQDGRRHLVRMQALEAQVTELLHGASAILAAGEGYVIYWRGDADHNGAVDLAELGMIERNASGDLNVYATVYPSGWTQAQKTSANLKYAAATQWLTAVTAAKATVFQPTLVATRVTAFTPRLDAPAAGHALATCQVTISDGVVTRTAALGAGLRSVQRPR